MPITITILGITVGVSAVMVKAVGKTVESKFRSWKQQRAEKKRFENLSRVASKNQVTTSILSPCHLAVLGDVEAGKTTLIRALQGTINVSKGVSAQTPYVAFEFPTRYNGEQRIIKGHDFSGSEKFIESYYEDEIKRCDCLFYICNVNEYLNNGIKREGNNARLHLIDQYLSNRSIPIQIILTYASQVHDRDDARLKFMESIRSKPYGGRFLERQPIVIEMKDDVELKNLIEAIKKVLFKI